MKRKFIILIYLGLSLFFSGCALYAAPKKVAVKIPEKFKYSVKTRGYPIKNDWWKNFKDKELNTLVSKSLKNNLNYLIAVKNIQVAKTYVSQNESNLFPDINFSYASSRNKLPGYESSISSGGASTSPIIYNLNQAGLNASYELDVWHQINNTVNQAKANVSVSAFAADVIKLTLISNVAQSYFQIIALNSGIKNLKKQYLAEKEILKINLVQYKDGLINGEPALDAKIALEAIKTELNNSIKLA